MEHFTFGRNNGLRVSALSLGAGMFGTRWGYGAEPEVAATIIDRFADAGGTFIDTAGSYQNGESEENLGKLLAGRREQFTIATKFALGSIEGNGVLQTGNGRRAMLRSVEASLRRLDTDYIDLLWVHFPDFVTPVDEVMRTFDDLASSGKVLYAGLSNFPAWLTSRAATIAEIRGTTPIAAVQFQYSLVERTADRDVFPMAEALGLGAALWSPLGGGLLTGKYRNSTEGRLTDWGGRLLHSEEGDAQKAAVVDAVLAASDDLGVPAAEVAIAWLLERGRRSTTGVVPVIGPRTPEQLDSYVSALGVTLGDEVYARLEEVSRIDRGEPHNQLAQNPGGSLGGDAEAFRKHPVPTA